MVPVLVSAVVSLAVANWTITAASRRSFEANRSAYDQAHQDRVAAEVRIRTQVEEQAARALEERRRDHRLQFLIATFRTLSDCAHRVDGLEREQVRQLESCIDDLQLFGSPAVVEATRVLARAARSGEGIPIDDLLHLLRDELRTELGAEPVDGQHLSIRMEGLVRAPE